MKKVMLIAGVLTAIAGLPLVFGYNYDEGGKIEWQKDIEQGLKEADKTGKPLMLYFTASW